MDERDQHFPRDHLFFPVPHPPCHSLGLQRQGEAILPLSALRFLGNPAPDHDLRAEKTDAVDVIYR